MPINAHRSSESQRPSMAAVTPSWIGKISSRLVFNDDGEYPSGHRRQGAIQIHVYLYLTITRPRATVTVPTGSVRSRCSA